MQKKTYASYRRAAGVVSWNRVGYAIVTVFWVWLLLRWVNLLSGGYFFQLNQPLLPLESIVEAIRFIGSSVPFIGGEAVDQVSFMLSVLPQLANAGWLSIAITIGGLLIGFLLGLPMSIVHVYGGPVRHVSKAYIEIIRGTPLLAQLFLLYYGLNLVEFFNGSFLMYLIDSEAVWIAILGLGLNSTAYQAEYLRSALISVDKNEYMAGRALGLTHNEVIRKVVLPQALRYAIPAWSNEPAYLIKASALAAFITVQEMFYVAESIAANTFQFTAVFTLVGILYLGIILSITKVTDSASRYMAVTGLSNPA